MIVQFNFKFKIYKVMKKVKIIVLIKWIAKYLLPAIIGWLEGDTHAIYDLIQGVLSVI